MLLSSLSWPPRPPRPPRPTRPPERSVNLFSYIGYSVALMMFLYSDIIVKLYVISYVQDGTYGGRLC